MTLVININFFQNFAMESCIFSDCSIQTTNGLDPLQMRRSIDYRP